MPRIHDLYDLRTRLQAGLDDDREVLSGYGATRSPRLKAYLLESNSRSLDDFGCPLGRWDTLNQKGWYINRGGAYPECIFLDKTHPRVWILYGVLGIRESDAIVKKFKRFRGVDLHTWDRVSISMGEDFAHLTIPGDGCVNAAPRIATLQGEDNAGRTTISFDGVELFA